MSVRGRFAPSPTGLLHVGNARTALATWLSVRSRAGEIVWRLEDLDAPRVVEGLGVAAQEDLRWLGLDWDEGPEIGGPYAPYVQSARAGLYEHALRRLLSAGRLFPCSLSRQDLSAIASAPHACDAAAPAYSRSLRPTELAASWFDDLNGRDNMTAAIRFAVSEEETEFDDRVLGRVRERVDRTVGDFVVKRRDGVYAYQLAVVVDDIAMQIDDVVRGADLLDSTARQIQLIEALGADRPQYAHVPLVRNPAGEKVSKRDGGLSLRALRDAGVGADQLVGMLAWSLGLLDRPRRVRALDLVDAFSWETVGRDDWILPADFTERARRV